MNFVDVAIRNARLTLAVLLFLIVAGTMSYISIPKEAEPDIQIPIIYVACAIQGISPEDSERLLLRPSRPSSRTSRASRRCARPPIRAAAMWSSSSWPAPIFRRRSMTSATRFPTPSRDLPQGADEPTVNEVNISEFPVLVVTLSGNVPERVLTRAARELRDQIEEVNGVLDASLQGARDDLVEVIIDPVKLQSSYGMQLDQLIAGVNASNQRGRRRCAGRQEGNYAVKVPR
jgi:multidrug efflux pump